MLVCEPLELRLPPFSPIEFRDLVSVALDSVSPDALLSFTFPPKTTCSTASSSTWSDTSSAQTHSSISFSGSLSRARRAFSKLKRHASMLVNSKHEYHSSSPSLPPTLSSVNIVTDSGDLDLDLFTPYLPLVTRYERRRESPYSVPSSQTPSNLHTRSFSRSSSSRSSSSSLSSAYPPYSLSSAHAPTPLSSEFPTDDRAPSATAAHHIPKQKPHPYCLPHPTPPPSPRSSVNPTPKHRRIPPQQPAPAYPLPPPPRGPVADVTLLTPPPSPKFRPQELKRRPTPLILHSSSHTKTRTSRRASSILDAFPSPPPTPQSLRELLNSPARISTSSERRTSSLSGQGHGWDWLDLPLDEDQEEDSEDSDEEEEEEYVS